MHEEDKCILYNVLRISVPNQTVCFDQVFPYTLYI